MLRQLRGFVRLMQLNTRREEGYLLRVLAEHERIVDAIEARDESSALAALREHLHTNEYVQLS
jgi:DNA-binding GntR family transcriptional regulator